MSETNEPKSRVDRLTERLLDDRARDAKREKDRAQERHRDKEIRATDPDPHLVAGWKAITDPRMSHMPRTPMRMGPVGFYIHCRACNAEFESKGWAYCPKCMELPAEERRAMKPAFSGRMCHAHGCENQIPRSARAGAKYCSGACQKRASRMSGENPSS
jgi:hypothetical protein